MTTIMYIENRIALINRMLSRPKLFCLEEKDIKYYNNEIDTLNKLKSQVLGFNDGNDLPKSINNNNNVVYARSYTSIKQLRDRLDLLTDIITKTEDELLEIHYIKYCINKYEKGGHYGLYNYSI